MGQPYTNTFYRFFCILILAYTGGESWSACAVAEDPLIPVYIECKILAAPVDCTELIRVFNNFTEGAPVFKINADKETAQATLNIYDQDLGNGFYHINSHAKLKNGENLGVSYFEKAESDQRFSVNSNMDRLGILNTLSADLYHQLLLLHPGKKLAWDAENKKYVLTLPQVGHPANEISPVASDRPWFLATSAGGSQSFTQTNGSTNVNGSMQYGYSKPKFRGQSINSFGYNRTRVQNATEKLVGQNTTLSTLNILSYSFRPRWSPAILSRYEKNQGGNFLEVFINGLGLEYNIVPERTNQNHEFLIRALIFDYRNRLILPNDRDHVNEHLAHFYAEFIAFWMFYDQKMSLDVNVLGSNYLNVPGYENIVVNISFSYRLTRATRISFNTSTSYSKKSLTFPKDVSLANPIQSIYLNGAPGLQNNSSIRFEYTIGNYLKNSRDRRWSRF